MERNLDIARLAGRLEDARAAASEASDRAWRMVCASAPWRLDWRWACATHEKAAARETALAFAARRARALRTADRTPLPLPR